MARHDDLYNRVCVSIERDALLKPGDRVVVGVSGGPDSLCLLHVMLRLCECNGVEVHLAHLNHCLRGAEADADADYVARLAATWGLPAHVERCDVAALALANKLAIEEAARQARYSFLRQVARRVHATTVAVGHNADDQVETVVMHWLRGSGLAGLRGMLPRSHLDDLRLLDAWGQEVDKTQPIWLIRPLLDIRRHEIEAYCAAEGLQPRFDRSNLDTTYFRNRVRHELLPILESFNPRVREVLLRTANVAAADYQVLTKETARAWRSVVVLQDAQVIVLDVERWRALPVGLQRSTVRRGIRWLRHGLRNIDWIHIDDAVKALQKGQTGLSITLPQSLRATLDYDRLVLADQGYVPPRPDMPWLANCELPVLVPGVMDIPGGQWRLATRVMSRSDLDEATWRNCPRWEAYLDGDRATQSLLLRPRRPGDRFCPQGLGTKPTTVANFMTNAKIPAIWRDHVPILVSTRQILWVAGWRIDERARVTDGTANVLWVRLEKTQPLRVPPGLSGTAEGE